MSTFLPIVRSLERVELARQDSDQAMFQELLVLGELVAKMTVLALVASVEDEAERYRYQLYHRLVRADGIGEWATVASSVVTGPAAAHFVSEARPLAKALTERVTPDAWQHEAVSALASSIRSLVSDCDPVPSRVQGLKWLHDFAYLRNKTRGHGAPGARHIQKAVGPLNAAIRLFIDHFPGFALGWAYLHRNLSGKYRVAALTDADAFQYLTGTTQETLANGVYLYLDRPRRVELMDSDPDLSDVFIANGNFSGRGYELLSYSSGNTIMADSGPYLTPAGELPPSRTQGLGVLHVLQDTFTNLPSPSENYIERPELEARVRRLLLDDRHPIVTLTGRGGIGKTSLALEVLREIAGEGRFDLILWFSARDIELLAEGAKPVRPHVLSEKDIADEFVALLEPQEATAKGFKSTEYFAAALTASPVGPFVVVLDNFETVRSPIDTFKWLDTHIRSPNKILITTRFRDFKGDYPEEVRGMTEPEFGKLIDQTADALGISTLLDPTYRSELFEESEGHPYVAKVLLGEIAKAGRRVKIERIVAHRDDILPALFERTFSSLTPVAQRVFLTLCAWRSVVPLLGLEAVLLRPENDRMDVESAVEELVRSSMIDRMESSKDGQVFLSVPLVAAVFGARKLETSIFKGAVEGDIRLLHAFGAAQRSAVDGGVEPRIRLLFTTVAKGIANEQLVFADVKPVLEYVARRYPPAWFNLAEFYEEGGTPEALTQARHSLLSFVEDSSDQPTELKYKAWERLATLGRRRGEPLEEVQAFAALMDLPCVSHEVISLAANRINSHLVQRTLPLDSEEKALMIKKVIDALEARIDQASATDLSRLAWLYLNTHDDDKARHYTRMGLERDPHNEYCVNLANRLGVRW